MSNNHEAIGWLDLFRADRFTSLVWLRLPARAVWSWS